MIGIRYSVEDNRGCWTRNYVLFCSIISLCLYLCYSSGGHLILYLICEFKLDVCSLGVQITYPYKYFEHIFHLKNSKLHFFNFGPIFSSYFSQLHYNTDGCRNEEIRLGPFSIRPSVYYVVLKAFFWGCFRT